MFYIMPGFVRFFFLLPQDLFWVCEIFYWCDIFALPHVIFPFFFFFSLPWIIEYIVLYHRSPWDCSFVRCTRTSWLLCRRTAFRDFSFHVMTRVKKQISRIITPEDSLTSILQRSKASQKIKKEEKIHPALISRTCCCLSSQLNELDWSFVFSSFSCHTGTKEMSSFHLISFLQSHKIGFS